MAIALLVSLSMHGLLAGALVIQMIAATPPFEFNDTEVEVELGMMEAVEVEGTATIEEVAPPPETPKPPTPAEDEQEAEGEGEPADAAVVDAAADAEIADAGVDADASPDTDAGDAALDASDADAGVDANVADANVADAGQDGDVPDAAVDAAVLLANADAGRTGNATRTVDGPSRLPPGQMIALRFDITRLRGGYYDASVRRLIATIGEWTILLEGSGVQPIDDFEQIFMATPTPLDFSRIAIVGRHRHDPEWVRARAAEIAALRGQTIEWRNEQGVWRAPWYARDGQARVVAILGPHHFAVCREEDLPRLLMLAEYRARSRQGGVVLSGPDSLLSMGPNEALSIEAQNIGAYIRRAPAALPRVGRLAIVLDDSQVGVEGLATYEDADAAETGAGEWRDLADRYASIVPRPLARLLEGIEMTPEEESVRLRARMDEAQARIVLGAVQQLFAIRREQQRLPPVPD